MLSIRRYASKLPTNPIGDQDEAVRLCTANMAHIAGTQNLKQPGYDRSQVRPGVVNIGLRDFHRVHNAVYFDKLLHIPGNSKWGMVSVGVNESHKKICEELQVQNSLYTVVSKRPDGLSDVRVIGSVLEALPSPTESAKVITLIGSNDIRMVTLTIKESDYHFDSNFTSLNMNDPHIQYDLLTSGASKPPRTAVGILAAGLYRRFTNKGQPITIMSCDNLIRNGEISRVMVESYVVHKYPLATAFHRWLSSSVFYPNTMCDRICLTDPLPDIVSLQQTMAVRDNALLTTESFKEWVVEKWMGDKPEGMDEAGINMVSSTVPYENLKTRLNYGTRLPVAIVAKAMGHTQFEDAMKDPLIVDFTKKYMDEVEPGLGQLPKNFDLNEYKRNFIARIGTEGLRYSTQRVVDDTSKKLRMDWQPVLDTLPAGASSKAIATTLTVWIHLLAGSPLVRAGRVYVPITDGDMEKLEPLAKHVVHASSDADSTAAINQFLAHVFRKDAPFTASLSRGIQDALAQIEKNGVRGCVSKALLS